MSKAKGSKQREPSRASLRDIPPVDFSQASVRRNPYAARIAKEGITIQSDGAARKSAWKSEAPVPAPSGFPTWSGNRSRHAPRPRV